MKKILGCIAVLVLSAAAFGQTFQEKVRPNTTINAGQCVAQVGVGLGPCNNFPQTGQPPLVVGVALNTVTWVRGASNLVTVQYAGIATVPDTSFGLINPGDLLGDMDGTGNLNDFGIPLGGPFVIGNGPQTYAGIAIGAAGGNIIMIVQPGFVPYGVEHTFVF